MKPSGFERCRCRWGLPRSLLLSLFAGVVVAGAIGAVVVAVMADAVAAVVFLLAAPSSVVVVVVVEAPGSFRRS